MVGAVSIAQTETSDLLFSEVEIETAKPENYKTLELFYVLNDDATIHEVVIHSKKVLLFATREEAMKKYFEMKETCPQKVVYAIRSEEIIEPEVLTFRVIAK